MEIENNIGKRIVLTCMNNLSYAGTLKEIVETTTIKKSALVELDSETGFSILCPNEFIKEIIVIPIS